MQGGGGRFQGFRVTDGRRSVSLWLLIRSQRRYSSGAFEAMRNGTPRDSIALELHAINWRAPIGGRGSRPGVLS